MRVAFIKNSNTVAYYCQFADHGERFHDLSEKAPAKCFKDMICDALSAVKNNTPSNLMVDGRFVSNNLEEIENVLKRLSTGYLIDMRYHYITEGDWRFIPEAKYNIHDLINKVLTERESKTIEEINEADNARRRAELETEKKLKESKGFQKFLKSMEHDAENSRKCREILEIMNSFWGWEIPENV